MPDPDRMVGMENVVNIPEGLACFGVRWNGSSSYNNREREESDKKLFHGNLHPEIFGR
ncbi:MAG: hypothetical protein M1277_01620 [Patescibacteria group bacterium]|nr:hypothetical protein [Patescibacteria group bacterium]